MISTQCVLVLGLVLPGQTEPEEGEMRGIVLNASQSGVPCADTEVVLQLRLDGQFVPVAQTTTDARGEFRFTGLPLGNELVYLPGANRDEIHYPGRRFRVSAARPHVNVKLEVCDSVSFPNPLVIRRHDVSVVTEPGVLRVTESLVVDNPTQTTFIGRAEGDGTEPTTLQLSIPPDFDRTTFHQEFYGRRFSWVNQKLVTNVPWTPGQRELKFTYVLRNDDTFRVWERPLDLPCEQIRVRVEHDKPNDVSSNLASSPVGDEGELVFQSTGQLLPAGHVIRVQLGRLPLPWMAYARWGSLGILAATILLGCVVTWRRPRRNSLPPHSRRQAQKQPNQSRPSAPPKSRRARRRKLAA